MAVIMKGREVVEAMKEELRARASALRAAGTVPKLMILRVGKREDDLAYEKAVKKRMEELQIEYEVCELPQSVTQEELESEFKKFNQDGNIHGILVFRPLPGHLDEEPLREMIFPEKDADGMGILNTARLFAGESTAYPPCTAQAVLELLDHYGIGIEGKKVTLIGRSMVVGKPLAMLLLNRNATVRICHTRTADLKEACLDAEILVAAAGSAGMVRGDMVSPRTVVIDVGINVDKNGNICGDVDYESAKENASLITPVPGGIGSITTSVLAKHVLRGAGAKL
ncbi:MAG: bifunctional 5,10-methylenetetrahydrofolate dehydrogenase/5,10-methenyltetrahydrofolate cyclohydrolase [Johnsonella sp.]|nr:bifunctional 5,10-methylenetetrahydrofolate dehydrogenase/5,10-methenyltetrahydrofolate cyclohydrolase [Johnsonella sp.]